MSTDGRSTEIAWIGLGSNVRNRTRNLARLRAELERDGAVIEETSGEVLTRAHGVTAQADFHNQVVRIRAPEPWTPRRWLEHCKEAETRAGRRETYHWGPRVADADILLLGAHGEVCFEDDALTVPHRELRNRQYLRSLLRQAGLTLPQR